MEGGGKQKDHSDKNWDLQARLPLFELLGWGVLLEHAPRVCCVCSQPPSFPAARPAAVAKQLLPPCPPCLQHASVPLLKEMLLTLDLARVAGSQADRRAADRLQRRLLHDDLKESGLLPVSLMMVCTKKCCKAGSLCYCTTPPPDA